MGAKKNFMKKKENIMLQDLFICHEKSVSWKNLRFINFSIFLFLKLDCGSGKK